MDARAERIGLNEAFFRQLNVRLDELAQSSELDANQIDLVCECGDARCAERIRMTRDQYETLRADPNHFAVHPGHAKPPVERVVERHPGFDVIEKEGTGPRGLAQATDDP
jgi:hypothetical protein